MPAAGPGADDDRRAAGRRLAPRRPVRHGFDDTPAPTPDRTARTAATSTTTAVAATTPPPRKRRLVTGRTILFTEPGASAVFVVAFVVTAAFGRHGYYVGFQDDAVAVFQGRPGRRALVQADGGVVSELERAELTPEFQSRIAGQPDLLARSVAAAPLRRAAGGDQRALVAIRPRRASPSTDDRPTADDRTATDVPATSVATVAP